jgi:hypothetical protein
MLQRRKQDALWLLIRAPSGNRHSALPRHWFRYNLHRQQSVALVQQQSVMGLMKLRTHHPAS